MTREAYLRELLAEGLERRYSIHARSEAAGFVVDGIDDPRKLPNAPQDPAAPVDKDAGIKAVMDRLEIELKVIEKTGFISYFLIVGDFVRYGRSKGVTCVARGSAAGSIVTYLLEISNVDPIRYGLLFERFLNPERVNPPDIDIDFADDRRGDVIEYVREKYGRDSVAQIITFGTMGAKSVVRDVGRVMGLSYGDCDRLAKMIPNELKMTLEKGARTIAGIQAGLRGGRSDARIGGYGLRAGRFDPQRLRPRRRAWSSATSRWSICCRSRRTRTAPSSPNTPWGRWATWAC